MKRFSEADYLTRILYINVGVFLIVNLAMALLMMFKVPNTWLTWIEMPASLTTLMYQPWSIISYMFLHTGLVHLIFNALTLYWFGKFFLNYYNQKQLTSLYFLGGIFGALVYLLGYNTIPYFRDSVDRSYLLGASASVMAIIFAPVVTNPNEEIHLAFIGSVKLKYLGLAFLVMDLIGIGATNAGGSMAHLGGAGAGALFAWLINKKGINILRPIDAVISFFANISFKHKPTMRFKAKKNFTDAEWNQYNHAKEEEKKNRNARVDEILDKIKKSGYDHLTEQEKQDLFNMSKPD